MPQCYLVRNPEKLPRHNHSFHFTFIFLSNQSSQRCVSRVLSVRPQNSRERAFASAECEEAHRSGSSPHFSRWCKSSDTPERPPDDRHTKATRRDAVIQSVSVAGIIRTGRARGRAGELWCRRLRLSTWKDFSGTLN